jgi:hypothetical protein
MTAVARQSPPRSRAAVGDPPAQAAFAWCLSRRHTRLLPRAARRRRYLVSACPSANSIRILLATRQSPFLLFFFPSGHASGNCCDLLNSMPSWHQLGRCYMYVRVSDYMSATLDGQKEGREDPLVQQRNSRFVVDFLFCRCRISPSLHLPPLPSLSLSFTFQTSATRT